MEQVASRAQQNNHQLDTLVDEAERVAVIAQQQQGMLSRYHLEDENDPVLSFETPVSTN